MNAGLATPVESNSPWTSSIRKSPCLNPLTFLLNCLIYKFRLLTFLIHKPFSTNYMKNKVPLLLAALFATACQQDVVTAPSRDTSVSLTQQLTRLSAEPNSVKPVSAVDFDRLPVSKNAPKFRVSLQGADGQTLAANTPVQPNTTYRVVVEGDAPAQFELKSGEGFDVERAPAAAATAQAVYVIKTTADVSPKLYLSVVPLQREQGVPTKGRAVGFLLPQ